MKLQISRISSLLLTGLIAGTFFYGTFNIVPTFYEVPGHIHLGFRTALMKHNAIIVMSLVILTIVVLAFYTWQARHIKIARGLICTALVFTIASLIITRLGSVPINMVIKTWDPVAPPVNWLTTLETWDLYNEIRTFTSIGSFIVLLMADLWIMNKKFA